VSSISATPTPNALSILTGPNGPLSNLPFQIPQSVLKSASPADLVEISIEAQKLVDANILFGDPASSTSPYSSSPYTDPAVSLLDSLYGVPTPSSATASPAQSTLDSLAAGNSNGTTGIPLGTSPSDQYLLGLASALNTNGSGSNITG